MRKILKQDFFNQSADKVARELLGSKLAISKDGSIERYKITETEAYMSEEDKASHASRGRTDRTEVMFGRAGRWYVYLVYGMYHMLNIVTDREEHPSAVLIRGIEGYNGPGKLTKALGIDKRFNDKDAKKKTGLWIEEGSTVPDSKVEKTPRIGIDYAGEWKDKKLRFVLQNDA